jgi:hypothetical protein
MEWRDLKGPDLEKKNHRFNARLLFKKSENREKYIDSAERTDRQIRFHNGDRADTHGP